MTFLKDVQKRLEALLQPNTDYEAFLSSVSAVNEPWEILEILATKFRVPFNDKTLLNGHSKFLEAEGDVHVGLGTRFVGGNTLEGPVYIGKNCVIGPYCHLRPYTIIGDDCHVTDMSIIKNSILLSHSKIAHHGFVGDSIVGEHVNLAKGSCLANYRLDGKANVGLAANEESGKVMRRKMGSILEDKVQLACNVVLNPGTYVREGGWVRFPKDAAATITYPKVSV
jgi:bifunctional UDP-N-acetylglucosamine pyrophosphorylase/glucosamine-1-phosphate N-acetyltransferase